MVKARWPRPSRSSPGAARARRDSVEPGQGAKVGGRVEIDEQHRDRPVALRLQLEAAFQLQRRAEQRSERHRLGDKPRHRLGIVMALEQIVDRRAEPHQPATGAERFDRERQNDIVDDGGRGGALRNGHGSAPRHQASTPFCACRRFSASSQTADCGPSITSSVTSSPRWAGRQCRKMASVAARFISSALTW